MTERDGQELTSEQRAAVVHEGSPLIVLACPGTGKTRVIIHRIAHLIRERGFEPSSVVGVTFTVKAAAQLRSRLAGLLGSARAGEVRVHTFNGLGDRIVNQHADVLGLPTRRCMMDGAQARRLLQSIILEHGLFPESRGEGVATLADRLLAGAESPFEKISNMGLSPEDCLRFAEVWRERLEREPGTDSPESRAQRAALRAFTDEARAFDLFTRARLSRGWMTYADQVSLPIHLLKHNRDVRDRCHSEFRAFVVDEFQDCNTAQIEFLRSLARHPSGPGADVCVVGDDDQSIYGFRGADDRAFERFARLWPDATTLTLRENFRSGTSIIETSNAIIARAGLRFRADKLGVPVTGASAGAVEGIKLGKDESAEQAIALMLLEDRATSSREGSPRPWSGYAVIARSHLDLDRVADALRVEGIPFTRRADRGFASDEGVRDVLAWVQWLVSPDEAWPVLRLLARPPIDTPRRIIATIDAEFRARRQQHASGIEADPSPGLIAWLTQRYANEPGVVRLLAMREALEPRTRAGFAQDALLEIMSRADPAHAELLPGPQRARRVNALVSLLALARDKQSRLDPPGDLPAFWRYYQDLDAANDLREPGSSVDEDAEPDPDAGVTLITAHGAKGLEFDTVFVPRVNPPHGYPKTRERDGWEAPPGLFDALDARSSPERRADEERRLFYVACTRAERRLVLLSTWNKAPSSSTNYFEELLRDPRSTLPISTATFSDLLRRAGEAKLRARFLPGAEDPGTPMRAGLREALDRARRGARLDAALALDAADTPGLTPDDLARIARSMHGAAARLGAIARIEEGGEIPSWMGDRQSFADLEATVARAREGDAATVTSRLLRPFTPPLRLSYTSIASFERCPLCYAVQEQLGIREPETPEIGLGLVIHGALERFYRRFRDAEAEGREPPTLDDLLLIGQAMIRELSSPTLAPTPALVDKVAAQLRTAWSRLHDPNAHIAEIEHAIIFPYTVDGVEHSITAKLDRLDLLPGAGVRIVDYKSGASDRHREPKKDDLQMGIYALALSHERAGEEVRGVGEYWCLATGDRGTIALEDLDLDKVRRAIDKTVRAMLAGGFTRGKRCESQLCEMFIDR